MFFPPSLWCRVALETLDKLTESLDFTDYASRIIHPIVRTLDSTPELRSTSMDTLSSLVFQLGKKVAVCSLWSNYSVGHFPPSHCWLQMNAISLTPTPPCPLLLPVRLLMSWSVSGGVLFMSVAKVTFTPSPPMPYPSPFINTIVSIPHVATSGNM